MTEQKNLNNNTMNVFSFGRPPVSIEILKEISGLTFEDVYNQATETEIDEIHLKIINLNHLKINKK